jgi:hypothetical protein
MGLSAINRDVKVHNIVPAVADPPPPLQNCFCRFRKKGAALLVDLQRVRFSVDVVGVDT